LSQTDKLLAT